MVDKNYQNGGLRKENSECKSWSILFLLPIFSKFFPDHLYSRLQSSMKWTNEKKKMIQTRDIWK